MRDARCVFRVSRSVGWEGSVESREEVVSHWFISASSVSVYVMLVKEDIFAVLVSGEVSLMARERSRVENSVADGGENV